MVALAGVQKQGDKTNRGSDDRREERESEKAGGNRPASDLGRRRSRWPRRAAGAAGSAAAWPRAAHRCSEPTAIAEPRIPNSPAPLSNTWVAISAEVIWKLTCRRSPAKNTEDEHHTSIRGLRVRT